MGVLHSVMALDYHSYDEAAENFDWDEKWDLFDGDREAFNITHECIDRHDPDATALRIQFANGDRETYTFRDVQGPASQFAHALAAAGVEKGDRVATMLEPRLELFISMFGTWKRGAVYVPMFTLFGPDAIKYRVKDSDVDMLITNEQKAKDIPDSLDVNVVLLGSEFDAMLNGHSEEYEYTTEADDVSTVQYTSGTTGQPKGVKMRHKTITNLSVMMHFCIGLRDTDRFFCTSPVAWAHGIWVGTAGPLMFGNAAGVYSGKFDPATALDGLAAFKVTNLSAAATALRQIVNSGLLNEYDLAIERVQSTGEQLDTTTQQKLTDSIDVRLADAYGVSEFGAIICNYNGFEDWEVKPGSIGKPMPGLEVAIIDDDGAVLPPGDIGEIAIKRSGEWFRTGDAGEKDEDGYFWHRGRTDDVIITAGYRVGPTEVEDALLDHPAVQEAAVVESPDEDRGNIVKAIVQTEKEENTALKEELQEFVKTQLSKHEYPREIEFTDEFPRTESGKIKRKVLKERERQSTK